MKKSWLILGPTLLSLCLAGCNANNDNAAGTNNTEGNNHNLGGQAQTNHFNTRNVNNARDNRTLTISDRAERQVEKMAEIDDAHVIISNNDAYVTVRFANNYGNNTGAAGTGNTNNNNTGLTGARKTSLNDGGATGTGHRNNDTNGLTGTRNTTTNGATGAGNTNNNSNGAVKPGDNHNNLSDGRIDGQGDAGSGNRQNTGNEGNNNVIGTGTNNNTKGGTNGNNTNGTSGNVKHYSRVSNQLEQRIADQVRNADNRIHKVYVSVNPDVYNRMGTFAQDIRKNGNGDGLFEDFTNTVNRFFGRNND